MFGRTAAPPAGPLAPRGGAPSPGPPQAGGGLVSRSPLSLFVALSQFTKPLPLATRRQGGLCSLHPLFFFLSQLTKFAGCWFALPLLLRRACVLRPLSWPSLAETSHTTYTHSRTHRTRTNEPKPCLPAASTERQTHSSLLHTILPLVLHAYLCVARQPMGLGLAAVGVLHMAVAASKPGRGCVHLRRVVAGAASRRGCAGDAAPLARKAAGAGWETSMFTGF